ATHEPLHTHQIRARISGFPFVFDCSFSELLTIVSENSCGAFKTVLTAKEIAARCAHTDAARTSIARIGRSGMPGSLALLQCAFVMADGIGFLSALVVQTPRLPGGAPHR